MKKLASLFLSILFVFVVFSGSARAASTVYVADNTTAGLNGIVMVNSDTMGGTGSFLTPSGVAIAGVAVDGSGVYVSSAMSVTRYNSSGGALGTYNGFGTDNFGGLAVYGGTVYVSDNTTDGLNGVFRLNPGTMGVAGYFLTPSGVGINGIAVDASGIYVSSARSVTRYDNSGHVLGIYNAIGTDSFGGLAVFGGIVYVSDNTTDGLNGIFRLNSATMGVAGYFLTPSGIGIAGVAVDDSGIYVSSARSITRYDNSGNVLGTVGSFALDNFGGIAVYGSETPEPNPDPVPEPATVLLLGLGLTGAAVARKKFRK